jgi:hypothetical protein
MADQLVQLLNRHGYLPVFARAGLRPPKLYTYEKTARGLVMQLRGDLASYLPPGHKVPAAKSQAMASEIESTSTSSKSLKGAVAFLERVLACIGITSAPKIDLGFAGSNELKFSLTDLEAVSIQPAQLDPLLPGLALDRLPPQLLADGKAYIAYEYLAASTVIVERADSKSFSTSLEGKLGNFIDAGAQAQVDVQHNQKLAFRDREGQRAAFAVKVGRIGEQAGKRFLALDDGYADDAGLRTPVIPVRNAVVLMLEE